jgi:hypothetical protein
MRILLIDDKAKRHPELIEMIESVFPEKDLHVYERFVLTNIGNIKPNIIIVHENNPEARSLENNQPADTYMIQFSGGLNGLSSDGEFAFYAGVKLIPQALIEILDHMHS